MGESNTLTVRLETVTPLFLGGADLRGAPELRPPPFRGAMRYWARAALGGVIGDDNLSELRQLEQAVFGSPDYGSPIVVQTREGTQRLQARQEFILPHKRSGPRNAFASGQTFELILRQPRSDDRLVWNMACASLALALTFGGVGLRSRRGYGTLRVVEASSPLLPTSPTTLAGWKVYVEQIAARAIAAANKLAQERDVPVVGLPKGPAAYPCATRAGAIRICSLEERSAMNAVIAFMNAVPKSQALGGISPRQASPLWVRPIQLDSHYGLLLAVLASRFSKGGENYKAVSDFLNGFSGEYIAVKGWNA